MEEFRHFCSIHCCYYQIFYSPYLKEFEMVYVDKMGEVYGTYGEKEKCIVF
jgi:hypothetical protein